MSAGLLASVAVCVVSASPAAATPVEQAPFVVIDGKPVPGLSLDPNTAALETRRTTTTAATQACADAAADNRQLRTCVSRSTAKPPVGVNFPDACSYSYQEGGVRIATDRRTECSATGWIYQIIEVPTGRLVGGADILVLDYIARGTTGRTWTHHTEVSYNNAWGVATAGTAIRSDFTCVNQCRLTGQLYPVGTPFSSNQTKDLQSWVDSSTGAVSTSYQYVRVHVSNASVSGGGVYLDIPSTFTSRCDTNVAWGNTNGCVFPAYPAVLTSVQTWDAAVDESAWHIRDAQDFLPGNPGRWLATGPAGNALHRLQDTALRDQNRRVACASFVRTRPDGTCDEYAFASTYEGAAFVGPGGYSVREVTGSDNSTSGSRLGAMYRTERVLDGESFWVYVVR